MTDDATPRLRQFIERLKAGDDSARWELLDRAFDRLRALSSTVLREDFPRVRDDGLWQTTDVAADVRVRLARTLKEIRPTDVQHFFRLAAQKVRWALLDVVRRLPGNDRAAPERPPVNKPSGTSPDHRDVIARLLELLPELPEEQYAVLDLEFSLGFDAPEIAAALGVDERTVRRRRRDARLKIARVLEETFPGFGAALPASPR